MTARFEAEDLADALTPDEVEFYTTARIAHGDALGWHRLMQIQTKVVDHQNQLKELFA